MSRILCFLNLHDWHIQTWKPEDGITLVNGELPSDAAYCWNCGIKRIDLFGPNDKVTR